MKSCETRETKQPDCELQGVCPTEPAYSDEKWLDSQGSNKNVNCTNDIPNTNRPHPSLEYPPLYFILKRFPGLQEAIRKVYNIRWTICYPLQKRILFSRTLRRIGVFLTWGELLILIPFFFTIIVCTIYSFAYSSVSVTGHACRLPLIFAFATAMHNSFFTLLLGIPFERLLVHHKLSGHIAFVNAILHTYVSFSQSNEHGLMGFLILDPMHSGGTMLLLVLTGTVIAALPVIRQKVFELFYYIHIVLAAAMFGCAFFHTGYLVPLFGAMCWGGDLIIRKVVMASTRYPRKANIRIISESVLKLSFPKSASFDYNPGQYIYLAVPELSIFQWHPFSLSSSPQQKVVTLHIRMVGSWTGALYDLAKKKSEISILFEGPYGSLGVDLTSDRYKMVMLLCGGIGVAPMQSICNQLIYEHSTKRREMKKIAFVWIERDPAVMKKVDVVRRQSSVQFAADSQEPALDEMRAKQHSMASSVQTQLRDTEEEDIASIILALVPASKTTNEQLEHEYPTEEFDSSGNEPSTARMPKSHQQRLCNSVDEVSGNPVGLEDGVINEQPEVFAHGTISNGGISVADTFLDKAYKYESPESPLSVLDLKVFLTAKHAQVGIPNFPFIHLGRPDIKDLFLQMKQDAIMKGEKRVAVCVCAPHRLVEFCRSACVKFSDKTMCFDLHEEVFG